MKSIQFCGCEPAFSIWLAGVYVSESHRGKKIAEKMIDKVVSVAMGLGAVRSIYKQSTSAEGYIVALLGSQQSKLMITDQRFW